MHNILWMMFHIVTSNIYNMQTFVLFFGSVTMKFKRCLRNLNEA